MSGCDTYTSQLIRRNAVRPTRPPAVDAPSLAAISDGEPEAFAEHLSSCAPDHPIATFYNLGRDAVLVAPCEALKRSSHAHLANFVRQGPPDQVRLRLELQTPSRSPNPNLCLPCYQVDLMWKSVGKALERRLVEVGSRPVWCSTSGLGVYWLHVRLDDRPKYYQYTPFTSRP